MCSRPPVSCGEFDVAVDHDFFRRRRHAAQTEPHALEALVHDAAARQVEVFAVAEHRPCRTCGNIRAPAA